MMTKTSSSDVRTALTLIELKPGLKFSQAALQSLLPDVETALFFGKVYELDHRQLSTLLATVVNTPLADALFNQAGTHSSDLQDYLVDIAEAAGYEVHAGDIAFVDEQPKGEILPELWKSFEVDIADSIKKVAAKLEAVVHAMPGKQGQMAFKSLAVLNSKRPTIGDHRAVINHPPRQPNLVILDVSGSMTAETVRTIVDDVVALSYMADAHLAIVSDSCTYWEPGAYSIDAVLAAAEYWGTHYEQLAPLFDRDWGVVVTIADYDSSPSAKRVLAACSGHIDTVIDISLVGQPTYLAECVGQLADEVRPALIAADNASLCANW